jgi:D-aminopeptidase
VRARALGVAPGIFRPGRHNAITDVAGVRVGHATVVAGDSVRTGVTAVLPHGGNLFFDRVPAAVHVGNAFGKFVGATQVQELGELETPVLLTCTLCVWRAADALAAELLAAPGWPTVRSINPVVGETNDGQLDDDRARPLPPDAVRAALRGAAGGPVAEGSVGAGTGTVAFGWKGGVGTASRVLPRALGAWTVGVLVQTNFGGVLRCSARPSGASSGATRSARRSRRARAAGGAAAARGERGDGSVVIVVATDAPLGERNLGGWPARAMLGLARTGSSASNGSGDYVVAFSTAESVRRRPAAPAGRRRTRPRRLTRRRRPPPPGPPSWRTTTRRRSSRPWSRPPRRRSTTRCSWPRRSRAAAARSRPSRSTACARCSPSTTPAPAERRADPHPREVPP